MADEVFGFEVIKNRDGGWQVWLPHQCQEWGIAPPGTDEWDEGVDQAEAVAHLERFIAEAQQALETLRAGEVWVARNEDTS